MRNKVIFSRILIISCSAALCSCSGSKKLSSARSPSARDKPHFEHEILSEKERKSPWEAKDTGEKLSSKSMALQDFIQDWKGTPHVMGGNTQKGVDCSGFVIQAYLQVYDRKFLGRRAEDLFSETKPIKKKNLTEGDLVFFKINGRRINHVGIYLKNDDFVHVSSSRGVMISNLNEAYFRERFFMGGRYEN